MCAKLAGLAACCGAPRKPLPRNRSTRCLSDTRSGRRRAGSPTTWSIRARRFTEIFATGATENAGDWV